MPGKAPSILAEPIQLKTSRYQIKTSDSSLPPSRRGVYLAPSPSLPQHQLDSQDAAPSVSAVTNSSPPQRQLDSQDAAVPPVSPATNSSLPEHQLDSQDAAPSVSAVTNSSPPPVHR